MYARPLSKKSVSMQYVEFCRCSSGISAFPDSEAEIVRTDVVTGRVMRYQQKSPFAEQMSCRLDT